MVYTVIGRESCPFCQEAKKLLKNKKQPFQFYDISTFDKKSALWKKKPASHVTVPVIFYNDKFIGGYTELARILHK